MPGYNRAELSAEIKIIPSARGARAPQEQIEAGTKAANSSGLPTHEAGPETTALAGSKTEVLDAVRIAIEAALDAGADEVLVKVEAQAESGKSGDAGGRRS